MAKCNLAPADDGIRVYRIEPARRAVLDEIEGVGVGYWPDPLEVCGFGSCVTDIAADTLLYSPGIATWWFSAAITATSRGPATTGSSRCRASKTPTVRAAAFEG